MEQVIRRLDEFYATEYTGDNDAEVSELGDRLEMMVLQGTRYTALIIKEREGESKYPLRAGYFIITKKDPEDLRFSFRGSRNFVEVVSPEAYRNRYMPVPAWQYDL